MIGLPCADTDIPCFWECPLAAFWTLRSLISISPPQSTKYQNQSWGEVDDVWEVGYTGLNWDRDIGWIGVGMRDLRGERVKRPGEGGAGDRMRRGSCGGANDIIVRMCRVRWMWLLSSLPLLGHELRTRTSNVRGNHLMISTSQARIGCYSGWFATPSLPVE